MKAGIDHSNIIRDCHAENHRADQSYLAAQLNLFEVAQRTIVRRAKNLRLSLDVPEIPSPSTLRAAQAALLLIHGQFLNQLRTPGLNLDGIAIQVLAMSDTLLLRSLALDFRSMPERASITQISSMTSKEFQDRAGRRIAEFREKKKFSQERLAQTTGTTSATIARIENGKQQIALTKLYKIAAALEVSPYEIMVGPLPVPPPLSPAEIKAMRRKLDEAEAELKAKAHNKSKA